MTLEKSETPTRDTTSTSTCASPLQVYVPLRRACSKCALPSRPMNCTGGGTNSTVRRPSPSNSPLQVLVKPFDDPLGDVAAIDRGPVVRDVPFAAVAPILDLLGRPLQTEVGQIHVPDGE